MRTLNEPNLVPRKSQNRAIPVLLHLLLLQLTLVLLLLLPTSKSGQVCQTQQIQDWSPCSGLGEPLFLEFLPYKKMLVNKNSVRGKGAQWSNFRGQKDVILDQLKKVLNSTT